jgi:hypothetical protein
MIWEMEKGISRKDARHAKAQRRKGGTLRLPVIFYPLYPRVLASWRLSFFLCVFAFLRMRLRAERLRLTNQKPETINQKQKSRLEAAAYF